MVSKAKVPDPKGIKRLITKHKPPAFTKCDQGLIAGAGCACWSLIDMSLIKTSDLVKESGQLKVTGYLPTEYNASGKQKLFVIPKKGLFHNILQGVIEERLELGNGTLDRKLFSGLNPESRFFLQVNGKNFDVSYVERQGKAARVEPYDMRRRFAKFYLGEGVTWRTLNRAFVMNYWLKEAPVRPADTVRNLMALTGLDPATIKKHASREETTIEEILSNIY